MPVDRDYIPADTTHCPCDVCINSRGCKAECRSFFNYTKGMTGNLRLKNLQQFIQLQNVSTQHFRN